MLQLKSLWELNVPVAFAGCGVGGFPPGSQPLPFIHKRLSVNHYHYNYCYYNFYYFYHYNYCYHYIYYYYHYNYCYHYYFYYHYFIDKRSPVNRSLKCLYLQTSH